MPIIKEIKKKREREIEKRIYGRQRNKREKN